ncbi:MAG: hypothetical protein K2M87_04805 [Muribaculaceae bacterium]|nr:hypothetical protein [Muribaculaceae bacterium]
MKMKLFPFSCVALGLLILSLTGCDRNKPMTIADLENPTTEDSLVYYFVQIRANEYWQKIDNDTTLRSPEEREKFLEGLKAGIDLIKRDNESFNNGVRFGTKLAKNLYAFEKYYGVTTDHELLIKSFESGLRGINDIPVLKYQEKFYELLNRVKQREASENLKKARMALIAEAREQKLHKYTENLYGKITRRGSGPTAKIGDEVHPTIHYEQADGDDFTMPTPGRVLIGAPGLPTVYNEIFTRLGKGDAGVFATPAEAIFGARTQIMGLEPDDILVVTVTINDVIPGDSLTEITDQIPAE